MVIYKEFVKGFVLFQEKTSAAYKKELYLSIENESFYFTLW